MSEATLHVGSGKVRELFALDDERLLLVASDRISVFDVVLPTEIPDKGRVLTGLSGFWFARTEDIAPNHLLALREDGRSTECRKLEMLPIECLKESEKLPEPIFTPTTKAHTGHDEPLDREGAVALVGEERFEELKDASIRLYRFASDYATQRGIILADTKLEFGLDDGGQVVLADEVFTPDSSRFWPAQGFQAGRGQPSFDKQYVRDYAESLGWDKTEPGPELPDKVVTGTRRRYLEAFERLTGIPFSAYAADPQVVLK